MLDIECRLKAYRFVAYSAVTFSVVAVLSVCVTLPMVYNYVHNVRRTMRHEIEFCKVRQKYFTYIELDKLGIYSPVIFVSMLNYETNSTKLLIKIKGNTHCII
mgnify:CR=1 FL=1